MWINPHDVFNCTWRSVVEELVNEGDVREYLPLKHCHYTCITLGLKAGIDVQDVAALLSNPPKRNLPPLCNKKTAAKRSVSELPEF